MQKHADALSCNPWLDSWPMVLKDVLLIPRRIDKSTTIRWSIRDTQNMELPLPATFNGGWDILSIGGGQPVTLTGLWDGEVLNPMGVLSQNQYRTWHAFGSRHILIGGA
jgi:hypothetical protein